MDCSKPVVDDDVGSRPLTMLRPLRHQSDLASADHLSMPIHLQTLWLSTSVAIVRIIVIRAARQPAGRVVEVIVNQVWRASGIGDSCSRDHLQVVG
jgi:hypothetical protein